MSPSLFDDDAILAYKQFLTSYENLRRLSPETAIKILNRRIAIASSLHQTRSTLIILIPPSKIEEYLTKLTFFTNNMLEVKIDIILGEIIFTNQFRWVILKRCKVFFFNLNI